MIPVYLMVASVLAGILSPLWFGSLLRPVRKLRKGAKWIDDEAVSFPAKTSVTVRDLREFERCGDKIVITHLLADWTREVQRKIFGYLVFNNIVLLICVVFYAVVRMPPSASFGEVVLAASKNITVSITLGATVVEIIVFVRLVSDMGAKYDQFIERFRP